MYNEFFAGKSNTVVQKVKDFFVQQSKWTANMAQKYQATDEYWKHASYVMAQYSGLFNGYKYVAQNQTKWVNNVN